MKTMKQKYTLKKSIFKSNGIFEIAYDAYVDGKWMGEILDSTNQTLTEKDICKDVKLGTVMATTSYEAINTWRKKHE